MRNQINLEGLSWCSATRHTMPVLVHLEVGKLQAPETTKLCCELTHVGNSHLSNAQNASCYSLNSLLPPLQIPNRTGAFVMRLWATVNPDATDAGSGWRISDTKSVVLDSLRRNSMKILYSQQIIAILISFDAWADNSSLPRCKDKLTKLMSRLWPDSLIPKVILTAPAAFLSLKKPIPKILHQIWW